MDKHEIAVKFRQLAILAGEKIMEIYNRPGFEVEKKSDDSPVTEADRLADELIFQGLSAAFDLPIVTEEKAETHDVTEKTFIIVDPLDGTKEFVQRRGDFTVNIALVENGVPTFGVVYAPAKERLFMTLPGGGAVEERVVQGDLDEVVQKVIQVAHDYSRGLDVVASKSHRDAATDDYIAKYPVGDFKAAGSSLKFCLVASGEAHLYPRLGRTMEWDTAAGHAVLLAAGGSVVDFNTHEDLLYGKPGFENPFFIAFAKDVELKPA
ncbi:MAG: 3'(2'),5'-bisphosphate nucleotidase CysQ [Pseudomonadota bacterium]